MICSAIHGVDCKEAADGAETACGMRKTGDQLGLEP